MSKDLFADAPNENDLFAEAPAEDTLFTEAPNANIKALGLPTADKGLISNTVDKVQERSADLFGNLLEGGKKIVDASNDMFGEIVVGSDGIKYLNPEEVRQAKSQGQVFSPLETAGEFWKGMDTGYVPTHTPESVKKAYASGSAWETTKEVLKYSFEQGVGSIPDMAAAIINLPLYITSRSNEIGDARAENKGKDKSDYVDMFEAAPFAIGSALLERIGAKGIATAGKDAVETLGKEAIEYGYKKALARIGKEGAKAGGKEALTEFIQEGIIEYAGEHLGTGKEMSVAEGAERGAWGALAGGVAGTAMATPVAAANEALGEKKPQEDVETESVDSSDLFGDAPEEEAPTQQYENGVDFETAPKEDPQLTTSQGATPEQPTNQYENGINMPQKAKGLPVEPLNSTIETPVQSQDRVDTDKRISAQNEKLKGVKEPAGLNDPRIKRIEHREALQQLSEEVHQPKQSAEVQPQLDDLITAIAKAGGINRKEAEAQGIDPEHFKDGSKVFGKPVFPKESGMSLDAMAETLSQYGYTSEDYSANELLDLVDRSLSGEQVHSNQVDYELADQAKRFKSVSGNLNQDQLQNAVKKALAGKPVGVREARAISGLMDEYSSERTAESNLDTAREQLEEARSLRRRAKAGFPPISAYNDELDLERAGEVYVDDEYPAEATGTERALYELFQDAREAGGDEDIIVRIGERKIPDAEVAKQLYQYIGELHAKNRPSRNQQGKGLPAVNGRAESDSREVQAGREEQPQASTQEVGRRKQGLPVVEDKRESERRDNKSARDLYSEMSREELLDKLLSHELTGIKGRRSFVVEVEYADNVFSLDADSLKWFNDNMSPESGDKMLQEIADALTEELGDNAYHISGDEFYVLDNGQGIKNIEASLEKVQNKIKSSIIKTTKSDGTEITKTGVAFTYGIGKDKNAADSELKREKNDKESRGERTARGEEPAGVTRKKSIQSTNASPTSGNSREGSISDSERAGANDSSELSSSLKKHFDKYDDTGEYTHLDLVDAVEEAVDDTEYTGEEVKQLYSAISAYRKEQADDAELGGRNDMDAAEDAFDDVLNSVINSLTKTPKQPTQKAAGLPLTGDLFGGKNETAQAIHDKKESRNQKEKNAPAMHEGSGDLFSDTDKQQDIENSSYTPTDERILQARKNQKNKKIPDSKDYKNDSDYLKDFNENRAESWMAESSGIVEVSSYERYQLHENTDAQKLATQAKIGKPLKKDGKYFIAWGWSVSGKNDMPVRRIYPEAEYTGETHTNKQGAKKEGLLIKHGKTSYVVGEQWLLRSESGTPENQKKKKSDVEKTKANLKKQAPAQVDNTGIPNSMQAKGKYEPKELETFAQEKAINDFEYIPEDLQQFIVDKFNENAEAMHKAGLNYWAATVFTLKKGVDKNADNISSIVASADKLAMNFKRIAKNQKSQSKTQTAQFLSVLKDAAGELPNPIEYYVSVGLNTVLNFHEQQGKSPKNISKLIYKLGLEKEIMEEESFHTTIQNGEYMDLIIEKLPTDDGGEALYFTHYFKMNGDLVMDSEMVFDLNKAGQLSLRETATNTGLGGEIRKYDAPFAVMFSKNLLDQGFGEGNDTGGVTTPNPAKDAMERIEASKTRLKELSETGKTTAGGLDVELVVDSDHVAVSVLGDKGESYNWHELYFGYSSDSNFSGHYPELYNVAAQYKYGKAVNELDILKSLAAKKELTSKERARHDEIAGTYARMIRDLIASGMSANNMDLKASKNKGGESRYTIKFKGVPLLDNAHMIYNTKEYMRDALLRAYPENKKEAVNKTKANLAAARKDVDTNPSDAQKEAGNYKKGHVKFSGFDITIENPKGSVRKGVDESGKAWESEMHHDYGYFKRTEGKDGDQVDVFIGDNPDSKLAYTIDQVNPKTGKFDEHKVMLGFSTSDAAVEGYLANYDKGWKGLGDIQTSTTTDLKEWLENGNTKKKATSKGKGSLNELSDFDLIEEAENFQKEDDAANEKAKESIKGKKTENRESRLDESKPVDKAYKIVSPLSDKEIRELPKTKLQELMPMIGTIKTGTKKDLAETVINWKDGHFLGLLEDMPNGIEFNAEWRHTPDGSFPIIGVSSEHEGSIGTLEKVSKYTGGSVYKKSKGMDIKGFEFKLVSQAESFLKYVTGKKAVIDIDTEGMALTFKIDGDKPVLNDIEIGDTVQIIDKTSAYSGLTGKLKDVYHDDYYDADFYLVDVKTPEEDGGFTEEEEFTLEQLGKAPTEKKPAKTYGKKNKIVKEDAAEKARALLKSKLGQLNSGVDPEILQAGITLAVYHVEAGARSFTDYSKAMIGDLGDVVRPYLRAWYEAARYYPGMDNEGMTPANLVDDAIIDTEENINDTSSDTDLERDSEATGNQDGVGEGANESGRGTAAASPERSGDSNGKTGSRKQSNSSLSNDSATTDRESRNLSIFEQDGLFGSNEGSTQPDNSKRSSGARDQGIQPNRESSNSVKQSAKSNLSELEQRLKAQKEAEYLPVKFNDINNIRETVPVLLPEQHDDVLKAENRFYVDDKKGMLFTNGTGTGKTYTGLGVAKRLARVGKDNILILVPTDKKAKDWIEDAENIGLTVHQLDGINDAGKGIVVTTYANFRDNESLVGREWDLVMPDEAHYLSSNAQGKETAALSRFRQVTNHEGGLRKKAEFKNSKWQSLIRQVEKKAKRITTDPKDYAANYQEIRYGEFKEQFNALEDEIKNDVKKITERDETKVVLLSATPFAYVQSIDYAEGYLFDLPKKEEGDSMSYNNGNAREQFYMTHFGYRMRYNRLTQPEAGVNLDYMERQFHKFLTESGALSGRKLNVDKDYSRQFIEIDSKLGEAIDKGISALSFPERIKDEAGNDVLSEDGKPQYKYALLNQWSHKQFNYLFMNRLLENLKAAESISRIKEHLKLGRKVVVFHSYKTGRIHNPFILPEESPVIDESGDNNQSQWTAERNQFIREYPDLQNIDTKNLINPIERLSKEFGDDLVLFNGDVSKGERNRGIKAFNDNDSGKNIALIQIDAGKEGISMHDIDAQHQRALLSLGMPNKPTDAIQMEGRIYRTGQASDAVFEYFKLGLGFEERTFASTIAQRSRTAENLAMGFEARNMERAFVDGYLNSVDDAPNLEQGTGGKESDARADEENGFDSAKTFYYANQKKNSRNKAAEGTDYFATPEPLGFKMAEWAMLKPNEKALEPSAGHGAIARFFPEYTINQFVEPSHLLIGKLQLNANGEVKQQSFEDLNIVNKYDGIIMNPPFGTAGRTAVDHVAKAFKHLRNGGRIVAIIPEGSTEKKFNQWFYEGNEAQNGYLVADISLPTVTFKRAGTGVKTRIVIIEKQNNPEDALNIRQRKVEVQADTVEEFFDEIEDLSFDNRVTPSNPDPVEDGELNDNDIVPQQTAEPAEKVEGANVELVAGVHTKKGHKIWTVKYHERVPRDEYLDDKAKAGDFGGRYSFYKGNGAIPGFIFTDESKANEFYKWITSKGDGARFKLQNKPASSGFSVSEVTESINPLLNKWKGKPKINIVQHVDELPGHIVDQLLSIDATDLVNGLFDPATGDVWIVSDNLTEKADALKVLLHEVAGHYGLRQLFGKDLDAFLGEVYLKYGNKGLAKIAHTYKLDLNKRQDRLIAAEEMLAHLAESGENPTLLNKAVAYIAELLRKVFPKLKLTNSEIKKVIAAARGAVENGKPPSGGKIKISSYNQSHDGHNERNIRESKRGSGSDTRADGRRTQSDTSVKLSKRDGGSDNEVDAKDPSTSKRAQEKDDSYLVEEINPREEYLELGTKSPRFINWFKKSKIVDDNGAPRVMFHGSPNEFSIFEKAKVGSRTKVGGAGLGNFFATDARRSAGYGDNVRGFYLRMEKPYTMSYKEFLAHKTVEQGIAKQEELISKGYDGIYIPEEDSYVTFESVQSKSIDNLGTFSESPDVYFSLNSDKNKTPEQTVLDKIKEGQPIDKIFRSLYGVPDAALKKVLGIKSDQPITKEGYDRLADMIENGSFKPDSKMAWMNSMIETARHGLIDRYKLTDEYLQRDQRREADQTEFLEKGVNIIESLTKSGVSGKEAQVLQAVLTGEEIHNDEWNGIAEPIRKAIDELGQEAVLLGLLSQETYEKNKGTYLHRVYTKHEADQSTLTGWVSKAMSSRRKAVVGNQLKRRGMDMKVDEAKLREGLTEWFGSQQTNKADTALIGKKFHVFDRVQAVGQGTETFEGMGSPGKKAKILQRVYWPADKAIPNKYKGWENRGEWEVTGKKAGKYELWRDFTKDERASMGEILDARYTIAKTFQVMAHDLSNGRFLKDIAENPEWTWQEEGEPENVTDNTHARFGTFAQFDWVKVPVSTIENSGGKKRWGALAGKYVRAEIWRDLNQLDQMQKPRLWNTILTQWKLNKTARNPVVHLNNVMSNLIFMDMADVRLIDLKRAFHSLKNRDADYKDAEKHGAFGSTYVHQELKKDVLDPLLDELIKQNLNDKGTMESMFGSMGKVADVMAKYLGKADSKMIDTYQLEDEIFRMATYLRRQNLGDSKEVAAQLARDQFLNYDIRAPWVNAARATILPFISYTYRAVPVIAKSVATRPWKIAKLATMAYALNAIGYLLAPGDEDEERRTMRDDIQGKTWLGTPRNIRMPFRDEYGNPVFMDIRRWIPAGDVFDVNQGKGALPIPAPLQVGGPILLAFELAFNKSSFTGKEIIDKDTDTFGDKAAKVSDWAWKSWMPAAPWIYNSWYWDKIERAAKGGRDIMGRDYDLKYAFASSVGVKLAPHDVKLNLNWRMRAIKATVTENLQDLRQLEMDKERRLINYNHYNDEKEHIKAKINRLEQKAKELLGK